jgi:hypothetical protein
MGARVARVRDQLASGRQAISRSSMLKTSQKGQESARCCAPESRDSAAERPDTPPPEFRGHKQSAARRSLQADLVNK